MNLEKFNRKETIHYNYSVNKYVKTIYPESRPGGVTIEVSVEDIKPYKANAFIKVALGDYMTILTPDRMLHGDLTTEQVSSWVDTVLLTLRIPLDEVE